ncbi:hypothetical protein G9F73_016605 [Clostridium estertheticum]|uniref:hypothetical protein n=1 Tax=Clostridium estertheticum TaxID=238834 RepID=UPI001CCD66CE|nr:hypothetical protein [Clostridium estertheticum]MBZ9609409.1 hypothetical protein [Clostridium estertheticum]
MFSLPLFKQSIKSNWGIWLVMTVIMDLILLQLTSMKGIASSGLVDTMFYGMLGIVLPTIYVMVTANKLLAAQVDKGSMAYILSTPTKRSTVASTQIIFMLLSLSVMFLSTTLVHTITSVVIQDSIALKTVIELNLGAFVCVAALGGICFMFSGIFNLSKNATSSGGLICIIFMMFNMLKMFSDSGVKGFDSFKYFTIVSLFDVEGITSGGNAWIWKICLLLCIAVITYAVGSISFQKKDLPL